MHMRHPRCFFLVLIERQTPSVGRTPARARSRQGPSRGGDRVCALKASGQAPAERRGEDEARTVETPGCPDGGVEANERLVILGAGPVRVRSGVAVRSRTRAD